MAVSYERGTPVGLRWGWWGRTCPSSRDEIGPAQPARACPEFSAAYPSYRTSSTADPSDNSQSQLRSRSRSLSPRSVVWRRAQRGTGCFVESAQPRFMSRICPTTFLDTLVDYADIPTMRHEAGHHSRTASFLSLITQYLGTSLIGKRPLPITAVGP